MTENSTSNLLVKYIYGEAAPLEYMSILEDLYSNDDTKSELAALKKVKQSLPAITLSPPAFLLSSIMAHSKSTAGELVRHPRSW